MFRVTNDAGAGVADAQFTLQSVKDAAGNTVTGPTLASLDVKQIGSGYYSLLYDAAATDVVVFLTASKAGVTMTGDNANLAIVATSVRRDVQDGLDFQGVTASVFSTFGTQLGTVQTDQARIIANQQVMALAAAPATPDLAGFNSAWSLQSIAGTSGGGGGMGGLTTDQANQLAAIKAKTDLFTFTGSNVNAASQNLPSDYQQRGVAVTLPTTAPAGYGGGLTGAQATSLAAVQAKTDLFTFTGSNVNSAAQTLPATAPAGYGGGLTGAQATSLAAVQAKTDLFTFTGGNVNAAAQNLPADYQQRGVAVTLPTTAPAGYGGGGLTSAQATSLGNIETKTAVLPAAFPANFSAFALTSGGAVTAGTVSDKTGYSLGASQTFSTTGSVGSVAAAVSLPTTAPAGYGGGGLTGQQATDLSTILSRTDVATSSRLAASAYTAAPTTGQIAQVVLANPAFPIATDATGRVTTANPAQTSTGVTAADVWAYTSRTLTGAVTLPTTAPAGYGGGLTSAQSTSLAAVQAKTDLLSFTGGNVNSAAQTLPTTPPAGYGGGLTGAQATSLAAVQAKTDLFTFTGPNVNSAAQTLPATAPAGYGGGGLTSAQATSLAAVQSKTDLLSFTGGNVNAAAQNLPGDYQQRGVAVTLPATAPTGYGGGGSGGGLTSAQAASLAAVQSKTDLLTFTGPNVNSAAQNLPGDYQQRGMAVTLPTSAPAGYGSTGTFPTVADISSGVWGFVGARALTGPVTLPTTPPSGYGSTLTAADIWGFAGTGGRSLSASVTVGSYGSGQDPAALLAGRLNSLDGAIAAVPAASVAATKADADIKAVIANAKGDWVFIPPTTYPGTGTMILKDAATGATIKTFVMQFNAGKVGTSRTGN